MPEPWATFAALLRNLNTLNAMVFIFTVKDGIQNIPSNSQKLQAMYLHLIGSRILKRVVDCSFSDNSGDLVRAVFCQPGRPPAIVDSSAPGTQTRRRK